jgi:hypothetical protein
MLANIPVSVVLDESAPLMGAAYEALAAIKKHRSAGAAPLVGETLRQK